MSPAPSTPRIIAGEFRGRRLATPQGSVTRPTLGRVRESLFGMLMPCLPGARVLDLFAGSGALGLEALSRGAAWLTAVEHDRAAILALQANFDTLKVQERARLIARDALKYVSTPPESEPGALQRGFDLILLDPPYARGLAHQTLERLARNPEAWLSADGLIVAQTGVRDPLEQVYGPWRVHREQHYGETRIIMFSRPPS